MVGGKLRPSLERAEQQWPAFLLGRRIAEATRLVDALGAVGKFYRAEDCDSIDKRSRFVQKGLPDNHHHCFFTVT